MSISVSPRRRGRYGFDAPSALLGLMAGAVPPLIIGVVFVREKFGWFLLAIGIVNALSTALFVHATRRGKFTVWARELSALGLRGDEQILDLGCGRGAVLNMAAELVPNGTVSGVDLWRSVDQSGNAAAVTMANAAAEGVADRVRLHTGDLRELPFADGSFDVVVSSLAIHNIKGAAERRKAITEADRVLRRGGRLLIVDISAAREYSQQLRELGYAVDFQPVGARMWFGGPWVAAATVRATEPAS